MQTQDITESTQTLTVATQKGIDLNITDYEYTMSIEDFEERVLKPAMNTLAAIVEYTVLVDVYKDIFNFVGTAATTPATLAAVLNAGARLSDCLAPRSDRYLLFDTAAMAATVNAIGAYFHKATEVEKAFSQGLVGYAGGFNWMESAMTPTHTNGSRDDTTPICNTSTGITSGSSSIVTTGADGTYKEGDVFTIADVYPVNRQTKQRYSYLQQFVMTEDHTNDATDTLVVSPTPVTSGAKQNIELVSAGASKAIVNVAAGGSGAASTVYTQDLAYHKDAFTFVTADLHMESGQRMERAVIDNISMRLWRGADIVNDKFPARLDVLFGWKTVRPEWATRVRG